MVVSGGVTCYIPLWLHHFQEVKLVQDVSVGSNQP